MADTFPTTSLLVSGAQGRNLSLVSPQVVSLVAQYPELEIVTAGVRLFERCSNVLISVPPSDKQVRRFQPDPDPARGQRLSQLPRYQEKIK